MNNIIEILKKVGAVLVNDHFVGTSGLHFDTYINKDFLYPHTKETLEVCKLLAEKYKDQDIEVVVGPALGGIILSQWTAHHLSRMYDKEVLAIYTEKSQDGGQIFTRGYENYVKDKRVLIVEDIVTTGNSVQKTIESVKKAEGNVLGLSVMINKNPQNINSNTFGVPFNALGEMEVKTYDEEKCPFCKKGIPVNTLVGHGKKYLEKINELK